MRHPWSLTFGEFLAEVQARYGIGIEDGIALDPSERTGPLIATRLDVQRFAALSGLAEDDLVTPTLLRSLCVQLGIPPEDFGLEAEDPPTLPS